MSSEHSGISVKTVYAFLNTGSAAVIYLNKRCFGIHCHIHNISNLKCMVLSESSAAHSKIL